MNVDKDLDEDLDTLYGVRPEEFTALRKDLAAAARKRGDSEAAKVIAAARRPTVAAWVVNHFIRCDPAAQHRMAELGDALRTAHAEMNGAQIRELSSVHRRLVHELVDGAFASADIAVASAALRDDVTATLQAAIADAEVAGRLGRLARAEQWSGFGDFGASESVSSSPRNAQAPSRKPRPQASDAGGSREAELEAARARRDAAAAEVEVAQAAQEGSRLIVTDSERKVATARRHYEELLEKLTAAEHEVNAAEHALDSANRAARTTADRVEAATAELSEAQAAVVELGGR